MTNNLFRIRICRGVGKNIVQDFPINPANTILREYREKFKMLAILEYV